MLKIYLVIFYLLFWMLVCIQTSFKDHGFNLLSIIGFKLIYV